MKNNLYITVLVVFLFLFINQYLFSENNSSQWVDSVYQTLTVEEKVAQLFLCETHWPYDKTHLKRRSAPEPGLLFKKKLLE